MRGQSATPKGAVVQTFKVRVIQPKIQPMPEILRAVSKVVPSTSVGVRPQVGGS